MQGLGQSALKIFFKTQLMIKEHCGTILSTINKI